MGYGILRSDVTRVSRIRDIEGKNVRDAGYTDPDRVRLGPLYSYEPLLFFCF